MRWTNYSWSGNHGHLSRPRWLLLLAIHAEESQLGRNSYPCLPTQVLGWLKSVVSLAKPCSREVWSLFSVGLHISIMQSRLHFFGKYWTNISRIFLISHQIPPLKLMLTRRENSANGPHFIILNVFPELSCTNAKSLKKSSTTKRGAFLF